MRAVSSLLLLIAPVPAWMAQTAVTVQYGNLPGVATYSNGYVLSWDSPQYTQFTLFGRNGKPAFSLPERVGDSSPIMWAVDSDGMIAAAYGLAHSREGRIDLLDLTGNITSTINTGCYIPLQIVFAPNHTIWTASFKPANKDSHDFDVLHHYARSGQELGTALPWSRTGAALEHPVVGTLLGGQLLFIANDRIGWNATLHTGPRTWVEVSLSGDLLGQYTLKTTDGLALFPVTMTADGNVYARITGKVPSARFAVLDRSKGVWQKVIGDPPGALIGSEGNNLVFSNLGGASTTLTFTPSSSLRIEERQP